MEGIARYIYETTKRMVLAHPEDEFHFFFDRPYDKQFIFARNVTAHILSPQSRHPILWHLWFEWIVPRKLKAINADVFLSGEMYLSLKTKVPSLMVSHDLGYEHFPEHLRWSHRNFLKKYSSQYHKRADHLIAVSEATKNDIVITYGIDENKITVATNATPEGFFPLDRDESQKTRDKHTDGNPYFIYVGSLHPRKNIARLLLAFDKIKSQNHLPHKLMIFGRSAFKTSDIYKTFSKMQHKQDVLFLDDKDLAIAKAVGSAEALCYVSLYEGFGIPILEAFSCGIPVITSNVSSMPEVGGNAAILVDPYNVNQIAEAMTSATASTTKSNLRDKGHLQLKKFSWNQSAELIYRQLSKLAK